MVHKQSPMYIQMNEVFKGAPWLQRMKARDRTADQTVIFNFDRNNAFNKTRLSEFEVFCDLCWNQTNQDIEYRDLQNSNHQITRINRAHSAGTFRFENFHRADHA